MKLKYISAEKKIGQSFYIRRENVPHYEGDWHYHEELELIYILEGEGLRIVGDNLSNFSPPQLALVGSWLPHLWKNVDSNDVTVDIIVIKFNQLIGGQDFFSIPEFEGILQMFTLAKQGIAFGEETIQKVHNLIINLSKLEGAEKIVSFFSTLNILSKSSDYELLSSAGFVLPTSINGENRLSRIINFISGNFTREINMDELALEAAMTTSSLCRFFKKTTNKTIFQFINEFRIGKACQMLIAGNMTITEVCFASGFNSLTTFNRVFKKLKNTTPSQYKISYDLINKR